MCRALQYRNTPSCKDGQSPAQKMYGRPIQDTLPVDHHSFASGNAVPLKPHVQHLTDMQLGSTVALQNPRTNLWDIYGMVVNISPYH